MSVDSADILLIGGGVAAASAAAELRERGFDGSIALLTRESEPPYHRPPVSKRLLTGADVEAELVHEPGWWERSGVELRTRASVMGLDASAGRVALANKSEIAFGKALLATGATVRRLAAEGGHLEGIHYLRAPGNARALREELEAAESVVIVGGSFVATEVAASLSSMGKACTMVMQEHLALERVLGPLVAGYVAQLLDQHGIERVGGEDVVAFDGSERVQAVRTASGIRVAADLAVVGVGALPDAALARRAGLEIGETGGVRCDRFLRTSAERVYAAGDMCEYDSPLHGRRVRIEHEDHAIQQGRTAAANLLGANSSHEVVPYFWSDLADWTTIEALGPLRRWDTELVSGSVENGEFTVWYLLEDRLVGSVSVSEPSMVAPARSLIASGVPSSQLREWGPRPVPDRHRSPGMAPGDSQDARA